MIRCEKIRSHAPILAAGEIEGKDAALIQTHLADCPDCQKSVDSARKLRSLIALKRHEKPDEFFFQTYVQEFHRRLLSEMVQKPSLWVRMSAFFRSGWNPLPVFLRLSGASVALAVMAFGFFTVQIPKTDHSKAHFSAQHSPSQIAEVASGWSELVLANNSSSKDSAYVLDRVNYEPSQSGTVVLQF